MRWDNGRGLGLVPGEDEFRRLTQEEIDQELRDQAQEQSMQNYSGMTEALHRQVVNRVFAD